MNITSFNVTDVGYHYIGLRVLAAMPGESREEQNRAISRSVVKYARDKALRLMLPEPKSSYETVGEKICQELAHFIFAFALKGKGYELTEAGNLVLALLNQKKNRELRRVMAMVHLKTYGNLRGVIHAHISRGCVFSPSVESSKTIEQGYVATLLRPTFGDAAEDEARVVSEQCSGKSAKKLEDALRERVLKATMGDVTIGVPLFRSMCDRLISLRLLNIMRVSQDGGEFAKSYSPCAESEPLRRWHKPLDVQVNSTETYRIHLSEPEMEDAETEREFVAAIDTAFDVLEQQAGYFDLPDVRDHVCEQLMIPETAFDDGVNALLDRLPTPITVGLSYDGISGRRKPLVRSRETTQIFNLIRRT